MLPYPQIKSLLWKMSPSPHGCIFKEKISGSQQVKEAIRPKDLLASEPWDPPKSNNFIPRIAIHPHPAYPYTTCLLKCLAGSRKQPTTSPQQKSSLVHFCLLPNDLNFSNKILTDNDVTNLRVKNQTVDLSALAYYENFNNQRENRNIGKALK